jgi:hypothetical protein
MLVRSSCITLLTAVMALSGIAGASAATTAGHAGATASSRLPASKAMKVVKTKGTGPVKPVLTGGSTVVAMTAFPTGGKGSGTEATCGLWGDRLQEDQNAQDAATDHQDVIDATNALNEDVDNALDAGCVVIYSAAKHSPAKPEFTSVKTVAIARTSSGHFTKSTWTAGPAVAMISAFPTGGKGSGTEATCALWSQRLQDDQQIIDNAPEADHDDASGPLNQDVDNALDAGCAVIY